MPQAKTAFMKSPGVEVDWEGPIELRGAQGSTELKVGPREAPVARMGSLCVARKPQNPIPTEDLSTFLLFMLRT